MAEECRLIAGSHTDARRVGAAVTRYGNTKQPVDQLPDIGEATKQMGVRTSHNQNINIEGLGAGSSAGVSVPVGGVTNYDMVSAAISTGRNELGFSRGSPGPRRSKPFLAHDRFG